MANGGTWRTLCSPAAAGILCECEFHSIHRVWARSSAKDVAFMLLNLPHRLDARVHGSVNSCCLTNPTVNSVPTNPLDKISASQTRMPLLCSERRILVIPFLFPRKWTNTSHPAVTNTVLRGEPCSLHCLPDQSCRFAARRQSQLLSNH